MNSPVRAYKAVGGTPPFIVRGKGSHIWDIDSNEYIDYVGSWGPLILGHADPDVIRSIKEIAESGTSFGAPTEIETKLAELVCEMHPACEMVRFVNSGTEATLSAIRLARGITSRDKIIKFVGCYHGHADSFLISAGSGALTLGVPSSPGVTKNTAIDTINCRFNDLESVESALNENQDKIACVIIEPVMGNCGCIPPVDGFLQGLKELCSQHGALLIFDEVMTGFRVAKGGASELYGVMPDIVTLGKIIGGGLPVGAYGGKRDLMNQISPVGSIYQAGTLSGNPLAMSAGFTTLSKINEEGFYDLLEAKSSQFGSQFKSEVLDKFGLKYSQTRVGSMSSLFFTDEEVIDDTVTGKCDLEMFNRYFHGMLKRGVYIAPSQFEAGFISITHSEDDFNKTISAAVDTFTEILSGA